MLLKQTLPLRVCLLVVTCATARAAIAQNTLEFVQDGVNNSYQPPVPKGPTSIPQTLSFFVNNNGSKDEGIYFQKPKSELAVTLSFDDQLYITVPQHVTGMTFGAASGASATQVKSVPVVNNDYYFEDSTKTIFTSHPKGQAGRGVNLYNNVGVQVFLSAKPLLSTNASTSDTSRYYYGKLRLQFSRPVNNPVISLAGLGATTNFANKRLGFATELELQTPGRTLVKLSGNKEFVLDDTKTKILHTKSTITGNCAGGAACGSVMVTGSDVTSLVFGVYLRTDGGPGVWGTPKVTNSGDMWHITISLPEQ